LGRRLPTWTDEQARRAGALLEKVRPQFPARDQGLQLDLWDAAAIALGEDDQTVP